MLPLLEDIPSLTNFVEWLKKDDAIIKVKKLRYEVKNGLFRIKQIQIHCR